AYGSWAALPSIYGAYMAPERFTISIRSKSKKRDSAELACGSITLPGALSFIGVCPFDRKTLNNLDDNLAC
ncbi:hypothetical protein, partial [Paraburkholderia dipogonis]|uniref:hypothetical protein n=1 Tax=Paraburkholderia dipogonis TaxID=1211383 RepID=UPI0038B75C5B